MRNRSFQIILLLVTVITASCRNNDSRQEHTPGKISGDLIIFHAGSLSVPFQQIADSFQSIHPHVNILREAAGSVACARKITELNKPCDIMASADYQVINKLLIPEYTDWAIKFASNEMVIAYENHSRYSDQIHEQNWYKILNKEDVIYGRSDPNSDPCGYRTVLLADLASDYYDLPELKAKLLAKDNEYIRPKETDLIALLQTGSIDYMFIYRSVAQQHQLKYVSLPDSINLKKPELTSFYQTAEVEIHGNKPGSVITQKGEPMVYGVTICRAAPNKKTAMKFLEYLLSQNSGMKIMEMNGQPSVIPAYTKTYNKLPDELRKFANNK
ncbi:MAG: tungstate ABC transporter substrate-binding protein WtpA [Bacteroidales bacterium]|nr:tungstate ABC transporter substrate-binding protein WtpA [Bacteroidales bacterium]MCF8387924.1 tungstate ABC transporter substrate-binding protein WtpA [Bacteroidales bacterium]MCF8397984.1 tungstate ABC transporter substrate-binding protein WtpA [Bacteroidales bacterium]